MNMNALHLHFQFVVVNDILSSGSSDDATAFFTGLLDDTFSNDSFTNDVISGGGSEAFTGM